MIKNKIKNKKGQMTIFIFIVITASLFAVILLFAGGIVAFKINQALDKDIELGQVNLKTLNNQTMGVFTSTYLNNADWWGLSIIFGMIFGLFLSAYFLRNRFPKWCIILDILILVVAFVLSLYISSTYSILLDSLSLAGETFMEDYTPKTAMFILNLPIFIVIIGVIMMVLFHSSIPKKKEETYQEGGFLQGAY